MTSSIGPSVSGLSAAANAPDVSAAVASSMASIFEEWKADPAAYTPEEIVRMMKQCEAEIITGDPVGTVRRDPDTGVIFVRVRVNGTDMWRLINPDQGDANLFTLEACTCPLVVDPADFPETPPVSEDDPTSPPDEVLGVTYAGGTDPGGE